MRITTDKWSLAIHSAAIIAYQLVLMQLISIIQWYHFAYMIISIAMLGFGASGTLLSLYKTPLMKRYHLITPLMMILSGVFMIISFYLLRLPSLQFDINLLFTDRSQYPILAGLYLIFFLPFFLGATAIGLMFIKHSAYMGKYYFSNLVGSGLGGIIVLLLLSWFYPITALAVIAAFSIFSGLLHTKASNRIALWSTGIPAIILCCSLFFISTDLPISQYKGLSKSLQLPDAQTVHQENHIHGLIHIVESPALRYAPALSLSYTQEVPVKKNAYVNANMVGAVPREIESGKHIYQFTTEALPYIMRKRDSVLVINAGTGNSIAHAISMNAGQITAVMENPGLMRALREHSPEASFIFDHPTTEVLYSDSRRYISSAPYKKYDAIILPRMESFGGSTGLQAMQEEYTLTLEAFQLMYEKLKPNGIIAITSWMDYPPRTTLKLAASLVQTLRNNNIEEPHLHLAAIRSWGTITFVLKKSPLSFMESNKIREFCQKMFFDPVLLPDVKTEERMAFNYLEDPQFFDLLDEIVYEEESRIFRDYDFFIQPATDDNPYFGRFLKISGFQSLQEKTDSESLPFLELGYLIVWVTLAQSALLAVLLIVLPLFKLKRKKTGKSSTLIYFAALGLGYMFVEIIFIQRFILYFGHPIYAISIVICTMLIASGAGSLFSDRFENAARTSVYSALLIALLLMGYSLAFTEVLSSTINFPIGIKIVLAFVLLAIPSFFMGMPFPSAIRKLHAYDPSQIPWAWGINGCLSVVATALATLIAANYGFRLVLLIAAGFYFFAYLIMWRSYKIQP